MSTKSIIKQLHKSIKEKLNQDIINTLSHLLAKNITEASEEPIFYSLPFYLISNIITKVEFLNPNKVKDPLTLLQTLIQQTSEAYPNEAVLLLNAIKVDELPPLLPDDIIPLISKFTNCDLLTKLGELHQYNQHLLEPAPEEQENEELKEELTKLKQDIDELHKKIKELEEQNKNLIQKGNRFSNITEIRKAERDNSEEQFNSSKEEKDLLSKEYELYKETAEKQIKDLQEKIDKTMKLDLKTMESLNRALSEKGKTEKELNKVKKELGALKETKEQNETLNQKLNELNSEIEKLKQEIENSVN